MLSAKSKSKGDTGTSQDAADAKDNALARAGIACCGVRAAGLHLAPARRWLTSARLLGLCNRRLETAGQEYVEL